MCRHRFAPQEVIMNENEKLPEVEIKSENPFLKWLDNYWYHYKWPTLIVSFFVIVLLICTLQTCNKKNEDISIIYAGPLQMSNEEHSNVESVMNYIIPEDFNGDGEKNSALITHQIYSREQIEAIIAQTDAAGNPGYVDRAYNSKNNENFYDYIKTGDSSVCLLDPSIYEQVKSGGRLMKLSDALGYLPEGADDEYGVTLSKLGVYEEYGALRVLPEDTVVCILLPTLVGNSSKPELYARDKDMLRAIIEFNNVEK